MSTTEIRTAVHEIIDRLDDSFLEVVHSMLGTYIKQNRDAIIGYDETSNPLYASAAKEEYEKRVERINKGDFTTLGDLKEEVAKW